LVGYLIRFNSGSGSSRSALSTAFIYSYKEIIPLSNISQRMSLISIINSLIFVTYVTKFSVGLTKGGWQRRGASLIYGLIIYHSCGLVKAYGVQRESLYSYAISMRIVHDSCTNISGMSKKNACKCLKCLGKLRWVAEKASKCRVCRDAPVLRFFGWR
jgi:hypothetical protein